MSNENPLLTNNDGEATNTNLRRVTLTRNGVAALFAQPSYTMNETTPTGNLTRPAREYRPPPAARSWLTANSSSTTNNSASSTRPPPPSAASSSAAQRSSLFRFVIQRSSSFATSAVSQVMSNTRRHTLKQIRSICNQHDKVSSIEHDVEPVASITDCLQAPSVAAVQICRSISMPNAAEKYRQHCEQQQQRRLIESSGRPI